MVTGHPRTVRIAADSRLNSLPLNHVSACSFDPSEVAGNIENFIGVAQVPLGLAGPLLVDGEHAKGEFYVPMATAGGTPVAGARRS